MRSSPITDLDFVIASFYREDVKNITVSLDDESYRRARMKAAEADTSVSALVRNFLNRLGREENAFERLKRQEEELRASITRFTTGDRLTRDQLHDRHALR